MAAVLLPRRKLGEPVWLSAQDLKRYVGAARVPGQAEAFTGWLMVRISTMREVKMVR